MPQRIKGPRRVLGTAALATVAYGEIASSLYFALGVVALFALGLTPWVLLGVGLLFLLVALSYAEGVSAMPETGGAATVVRRAFNDPAGFFTGWAIFLDYLIVIALAGLFFPHYLGHAIGWEAATRSPWDVVLGVLLICSVAAVWLLGQRRLLRRLVTFAALLAFVCLALLVVLGLVVLFSGKALGHGVEIGVAPTWRSLAFALPVAMLAYTGLESVANLAAETREPGRTLPRGLFVGIGAAVVVSVGIALVGISAFPAHQTGGGGGESSDLGGAWLQAPLVGITSAFGGHLPAHVVDALRVFVGLSGALVLVVAVTTATAGAGRLSASLAQHGMIPHAFGTPGRRTMISPASIVTTAAISSLLLVLVDSFSHEVRFLASLYSFGVLLAFTMAQLAVIRLRFSEPALERPFRVPGNVMVRGRPVPVAALVGAPLTFAIWIASMATHSGARIAGPVWMLIGFAVYVSVRRGRGEGLLEHVEPAVADLVPTADEGDYERILVPLKLGAIGDEVLATAIKLAEEEHASVHVLHAIRVPMELGLDAEMTEAEERARESIEEAKALAAEHGVEVEGEIVRTRSIGEAIVEHAGRTGSDLVLLGSAPRWRRQSRFFSPTVDYVLRKAPCEVMVIAYPQGVLEEDESATLSS